MTTQTLKFSLPGKWARIDLTSESASRASIRRLTETVTNRRDDLATFRAEMRDRFQTAADAARENGAVDMRIALELAKGVPLPAWAVLFEPDVQAEDLERLGLGDFEKVLEIAVKRDDVEQAELEVEPERIHAIRQSWRRVSHVAEGNVERDFELIEADYWLATANPNRIALLTFSTAYADYEEEMLGLFDAIVGTIRWEAPTEEAAPTSE